MVTAHAIATAAQDETRQMIVSNVRRFLREQSIPLEAELDPDAHTLPRQHEERLAAMVRAMGLWQIGVPTELGGAGLDPVTQCSVLGEISQHRAGLDAPAYDVFGHEPHPVLFAGTGAQKEKYLYPSVRGEKHGFFGLTEPTGSSDSARAIETKGVRDGDDWLINGSKVFNSGADTAAFGLVLVRAGAAREHPRPGRRRVFDCERAPRTIAWCKGLTECDAVLAVFDRYSLVRRARPRCRPRRRAPAGLSTSIHWTKGVPLERWYRELRVRRIGEWPSEVQRVIMARDLLNSRV